MALHSRLSRGYHVGSLLSSFEAVESNNALFFLRVSSSMVGSPAKLFAFHIPPLKSQRNAKQEKGKHTSLPSDISHLLVAHRYEPKGSNGR